MQNATSYLLTALSLAAPIIIVEAARSQSATDVSQIAQEVTAIIEGDNSGSAILLGKQGKTYTVITNWHVLKARGQYSLRTHDGQVHNLVSSSIQQIGNVDLATAQFTSAASYRLARVASTTNVPVGTAVFVAGAPSNLQGLENRNILVVPGNIVGTEKPAQQGYSMIYNNNTMPGMSGGAVLNTNGELIGIHGRGTRDVQAQKAGFNLGISVSYLPASLLARIGSNTPAPSASAAPTAPRRTTLAPVVSPAVPEPANFVPSRPQSVDGSQGADGVCTGSRC
jgi:serine protease Do